MLYLQDVISDLSVLISLSFTYSYYHHVKKQCSNFTEKIRRGGRGGGGKKLSTHIIKINHYCLKVKAVVLSDPRVFRKLLPPTTFARCKICLYLKIIEQSAAPSCLLVHYRRLQIQLLDIRYYTRNVGEEYGILIGS